MPNMKNAKKRVLVNIKKEKANNEFEASMKTAIKNVERAVASKDKEKAKFINYLLYVHYFIAEIYNFSAIFFLT